MNSDYEYTEEKIGFNVGSIHGTRMHNIIRALSALHAAVEQCNPSNLADFIDGQFPKLTSQERLTLMVIYETIYIESQFSKGFN